MDFRMIHLYGVSDNKNHSRFSSTLQLIYHEMVKQSHYRPGVASKVPRFHDNGTGWW